MVLAAGGGTRFAGSGHKLVQPFRGRPLVAWALQAAAAADLEHLIVVTGSVTLPEEAVPAGALVVHNGRWADGLATSLHCALATAGQLDCEAVVVGLGDQPLVPTDAWRAVSACDTPIAVATYDGRRRNPVRLHRSVWPLLPASGDEGARTLMAARPDLVGEVPCTGDPADVDTVEDLARWN